MSEKKAAEEITFLVTNNPLENSSANKRRVRSVAALKSWPGRRKKSSEQAPAYANQGGFILDLPGPSNASDRGEPARKRQAKASDKAIASSSSATTQFSSHPPEAFTKEQEPLFEVCTRANDPSCTCSHCEAERKLYGRSRPAILSHTRKRDSDGNLKETVCKQASATRSPASSPPSPSPSTTLTRVTNAEPFGQYPVPYRSWFDQVLNHMMHVFAPRGWPALGITNAEGLRWERFMTQHALAEPALFYVRLLFASGDLLRLDAFDEGRASWLRERAVEAINAALSDPKRATSDPLILAVGRIALHENLYGDRNAANTVHRPAQKRMIELRGGMGALPFPELVKRLMRWGDTVMSKQGDTPRLLEDDEENANFSLNQHIAVLEQWVPSEGQDLRRKIRIADLLSPEPS